MVKTTGYTIVTRAALQVKDRSVVPPDRVIFNYDIRVDGVIKSVTGNWGDYLRDVDAKLVVKRHAPLDNDENPEDAHLITDLYPEGIPDKTFIPDPTLPL